MPKKQLLGSILIIVILSFICMYIYNNFKVESKTSLIVKDNSKEVIVSYYNDIKKDNYYYTYNIEDIIVDYSDRRLDLNKALEVKQITIDEVINFMKKQFSLEDGRVTMYQNDDLSLVVCKLDNKTNYIFSKPGLEYHDGLCSSTPYVCSFKKTYYVLDISDSKKTDDKYVTFKSDEADSPATVLMDKEKAELLVKEGYYEFTFASVDNIIEEDIKSIFDNSVILDVKASSIDTQVNENICK